MPYKSDKMKLNSPFLDRRIKLLPCQREMVLYWTDKGLSQRKIAKMFNVSRRLITFVQDPKKKEKDLQNREERGGWKQYYKGGEEWAKMQREHRKYKYEILIKKKYNRMTPMQKAKELIDKNYQIFVDDEDEHFIDTSERISKKCALIAVDEILLNPTPKQKIYWQQVKQEIQKLL